jgi:hypothetical protein
VAPIDLICNIRGIFACPEERAMPSHPYVEQLGAILGTPDASLAPIDWAAVESATGLVLPADYKELQDRYRPSWFAEGFLWMPPPVSPPDWDQKHSLAGEAEQFLDDARNLREQSPETCPYPLFPEPGGIYPWACSNGNDVLWWRTVGSPDDWPTIVQARDQGEDDWWEYACSASELLVKLLTGEIRCPVFPYLGEGSPK